MTLAALDNYIVIYQGIIIIKMILSFIVGFTVGSFITYWIMRRQEDDN